MLIHARLHTGERPYLCKYAGCGRRYKWLSSINFHEGRCEKKTAGLAVPAPRPPPPPAAAEAARVAAEAAANVRQQEVHTVVPPSFPTHMGPLPSYQSLQLTAQGRAPSPPRPPPPPPLPPPSHFAPHDMSQGGRLGLVMSTAVQPSQQSHQQHHQQQPQQQPQYSQQHHTQQHQSGFVQTTGRSGEGVLHGVGNRAQFHMGRKAEEGYRKGMMMSGVTRRLGSARMTCGGGMSGSAWGEGMDGAVVGGNNNMSSSSSSTAVVTYGAQAGNMGGGVGSCILGKRKGGVLMQASQGNKLLDTEDATRFVRNIVGMRRLKRMGGMVMKLGAGCNEVRHEVKVGLPRSPESATSKEVKEMLAPYDMDSIGDCFGFTEEDFIMPASSIGNVFDEISSETYGLSLDHCSPESESISMFQ